MAYRMDSIEKVPLPNNPDFIPVYITKVASVDKIFIRLLHCMDDYVSVMGELKRYYDGKPNLAFVDSLPEGDDAILDNLFILKHDGIYNRARVKEVWPNNCYYVELIDEGFHYLANEKELIRNDNPNFMNTPTHGFVYSLDFGGRTYDSKFNYLINYGLQKIANSQENFFISLSRNQSGITLYYQEKNGNKTSVNDYLFNFAKSLEKKGDTTEIENNIDAHLASGMTPEAIPIPPSVSSSSNLSCKATYASSSGDESRFFSGIPKFIMPDDDVELKMKVKHVFNPSDFYLKLKKNPDAVRFNEELDNFYKKNAPTNPTEILVNKNLYITNFKDKWIRLLILGMVKTSQFYSCLLFDKGIVGTISTDDIFALDDRFKRMPPRAVRSCLAFVKPAADKWTKEANDFFKNQTKGDALNVYPIIYEEDGILFCSLIKGDQNISDLLNQVGHAQIDY